jgi:FtsH-binding integral membrane protein
MFNDKLINQDETGSKASIVDDFMYGNNVASSHVTIRLGFIRKVYGILAIQLAFTTLIGTLVMASAGLQGFLKEKYAKLNII